MGREYTERDPFGDVNAELIKLNIQYSELPSPFESFDPSIVVEDPALCRKGGLVEKSEI